MSTRDLVYVALFAAIMAVLGLVPAITLPVVGVPITAQSMGCMLAGGVLGARRGALSMLLFLALVAAGLPLLAGGRGGLGVFAGPSVGFLIGFPVAAFAVGHMTERLWRRLTLPVSLAINLVGGIVVLYALGVPGIALVTGRTLTEALVGSALFLPGDLIKAVVAALVVVTVKRSHPVIAAAR
ncbi:MAG TPA: biotin transporter BioY [Alphaproteobacteria bacterium]|nr:biotin transporter BioY [Alphaproteobacteria bacterium]